VLEGILRRKLNTQLVVYNLGVPGRQSEDIVHIAEKWVPVLKPEIVIYGICQNDFLPSLMPQYENNMRWEFPLPRFIKKPLETKTRAGNLFADRYNRLLMSLGIRNDFYTDILRDIGNYQERFRPRPVSPERTGDKGNRKASHGHGAGSVSWRTAYHQ